MIPQYTKPKKRVNNTIDFTKINTTDLQNNKKQYEYIYENADKCNNDICLNLKNKKQAYERLGLVGRALDNIIIERKKIKYQDSNKGINNNKLKSPHHLGKNEQKYDTFCDIPQNLVISNKGNNYSQINPFNSNFKNKVITNSTSYNDIYKDNNLKYNNVNQKSEASNSVNNLLPNLEREILLNIKNSGTFNEKKWKLGCMIKYARKLSDGND